MSSCWNAKNRAGLALWLPWVGGWAHVPPCSLSWCHLHPAEPCLIPCGCWQLHQAGWAVCRLCPRLSPVPEQPRVALDSPDTNPARPEHLRAPWGCSPRCVRVLSHFPSPGWFKAQCTGSRPRLGLCLSKYRCGTAGILCWCLGEVRQKMMLVQEWELSVPILGLCSARGISLLGLQERGSPGKALVKFWKSFPTDLPEHGLKTTLSFSRYQLLTQRLWTCVWDKEWNLTE